MCRSPASTDSRSSTGSSRSASHRRPVTPNRSANGGFDTSRRARANLGATIMGRNMFGPVRGPWPDNSWQGWWGEDPPYHHPVFVLTHHAREPLKMEGGTTFYFVGDGIESALAQAKDAARGRDIWLAGGAGAVNQYLAAGLVDEIDISIAPVIVGAGARLFDGLKPGTLKLRQIRAVDAPGVIHMKIQARLTRDRAIAVIGGARTSALLRADRAPQPSPGARPAPQRRWHSRLPRNSGHRREWPRERRRNERRSASRLSFASSRQFRSRLCRGHRTLQFRSISGVSG